MRNARCEVTFIHCPLHPWKRRNTAKPCFYRVSGDFGVALTPFACRFGGRAFDSISRGRRHGHRTAFRSSEDDGLVVLPAVRRIIDDRRDRWPELGKKWARNGQLPAVISTGALGRTRNQPDHASFSDRVAFIMGDDLGVQIGGFGALRFDAISAPEGEAA